MLDVKRADAYVSFFGSSAIPLLVSSCRAVTDVVGAINAAAACTCANILYTRTAWVCALYDIARHGSMQDAAEAMEVKLRRMGQQQVCATCPTQCIGKPAAHAARGGGGALAPAWTSWLWQPLLHTDWRHSGVTQPLASACAAHRGVRAPHFTAHTCA